MFDPNSIHEKVNKIKKQTSELDELLKTKCEDNECTTLTPPNDESEKPTIEAEEK